jgi:flagellar capping protein FliD
MSMSVDGLVSGMDTTTIISQLLQAEAGQQNALKTKLTTVQTAASAYRTVNTTFLAVSTAADAALSPTLWASTKATSSANSVAVSSSPGALTGSLSFSVQQLASAHAVVNRNTGTWTAATAAYGSSSIEVFDKSGVSKGTISIGGSKTVADAAAAINASSYGLSAAVVQISATEVGLHVTARTTGVDSTFSLSGSGSFSINTQAQNAQISIGTTTPYTVSSATNTFNSVLPGTTFTVNKADPLTPVTVGVVPDPDSVAAKVSALVDAVNSAAGTVRTYTSNAPGSTAALKGEYSVSSLGGKLLDAISSAVGSDGSPAKLGFQLTKDGTVTFDKTKFLAALSATPDIVKRMISGTPGSNGPDGAVGGGDDVAAVTGIAAKLRAVSVSASDSTTGTLVALANGQDSMVKDIKDRIADWDLRLATRKAALTHQFSAMETALSSLKNQSNWLAGQINSLPKSS